ncbi:hypothetical protein [Methylomarinum vadi]|uniref:hypothetical protein n=1 Tax=Methylomarinum vadi TaxID=438855 RepID=UPI0004DF6307|nr:hypothetical protein [Methylomarinum vadi]
MFVYSLPIFFHEMRVVEPWELLLATLMLAGFFWISSPEPAAEHVYFEGYAGLRHYLLRAWLGKATLWQVFWPFFLLLNGILYAVDTVAKRGEFTVSSWDEVHFILLTPVLFWTLCVWRNSANCRSRFWSALARLTVLAVYFEYVLKLIIRLDYPRLFFNCHEFLLDYGVCF